MEVEALRILLVAKEKDELRRCKEYIGEFYPDGQLACFESSEAAAEYVDEHDLDICFTDIVLSPITGIALLKRIRAKNTNAKVVFLSEDTSFALEAWRVYANDFLLKPITREKIEHATLKIKE